MAEQITTEEWRRLQGRNFNTDDELRAALEGKDADIDNETMTAIGGGYRAGALDLPPFRIGLLPLLEVIDSAFVREDVTEIPIADIAQAVYVWANGRAAIAPILGITRRRQALERVKGMADKGPEYFARYLEAIDRVESAWADFEAAAFAFFDGLGAVELEEVTNTIIDAMNEAFAGFQAVPGDGDGAKKNGASIANGSDLSPT